MTGDADRPGKPACAQGLTELGAHAVPCVGEDCPEANAGGDQAIEFGERNLRLGPRRAILGGHAGPLEPSFVAGPDLRQEQSQAHHHRDLDARQRQRHQGLTIRSLAQCRRILRPDPDRMGPLLRQRRVVDDKEGVPAADQLVRLDRKLKLQRTLVPDPVRHEMVQPVVIARRDLLGHRADALAIARPNQPRHIQRTHPPPRLMTEPFHKRRQPPPKLVPPFRHATRSQIRARILPSAWLTNSYSVKVVLVGRK